MTRGHIAFPFLIQENCMSSVIYTNTASLVAQKNLLGAQNALATSVERLSSGLRINRARDDAAGLSVANSLQSQINGANQGIRNMNDAISMVQTAEGAIAAASEMGQRIQTLATQAANSTLGDEQRASIKSDMLELLRSIDSITKRTEYAGNDLLNFTGATNNSLFSMQISNDSSDRILLSSDGFKNIGMGVQGTFTYAPITLEPGTTAGTTTSTVYVLTGSNQGVEKTLIKTVTSDGAANPTYSTVYTLNGEAYNPAQPPVVYSRSAASGSTPGQASELYSVISVVDTTSAAGFGAIQDAASSYVLALNEQRSLLGAYQNRMEYTLSNITELSANLSASKSRVIDTDYASETAALTRGQILQQAATAMLAQANQMPNVILTLLK